MCNVCDTEITGSVSAHAKEPMLAGEGSGHRSEVVQVLVGHEMVEHPEEGHWETVVIGGHWERIEGGAHVRLRPYSNITRTYSNQNVRA